MTASAAVQRWPGVLAQWLRRLAGDWPLVGRTVPLERERFRALFQARPAFADYLPFAGYEAGDGVFLLDDGVSVGVVFRLTAVDLDARAPERQAEFNTQLDHVLRLLPADDERYPYILQLYLEDREPAPLAAALAAAAPAMVRETAYSQAWFAAQGAHFAMMRSPRGLFPDERTGAAGTAVKGWRAIDQRIYACVYRKAPAKAWAHRSLSPAQQLNRALAPFWAGLAAIGVGVRRLDEDGLRDWLLPWLTPVVAGFDTPHDYLAAHPLPPLEDRGAGWLLAQHLAQVAPQPIPDRDPELHAGVWRFGPVYTRYLTFQGIEFRPDDGVFTLDRQDGHTVRACPWDRMPPGSILTWTLVPRAPAAIDAHLDALQLCIDHTTSDAAAAAREELAEAKAARRQHQLIYNVQMGLYLRASSLAALDEHTLQAGAALAPTRLRPIPARHDLLADDSFVRALPMVYDWRHDRLHALRSRLTYTAHLASTLPLSGRATGTDNPCFVQFRRDGQVFTFNPYHPGDRVRVAHLLLFGPSGSGKSATAVAMALSSMAVNRPRQIFIEKGNSFGLMVAYYARHGLQTRQILFNRGQDACFPPYVETPRALAEHRGRLAPAGDEDEHRSYLAEMLYMTELMVTGGRVRDSEALTTSDRAGMQTALIRALEASERAGEPHARPADVARELRALAEAETVPEIRLSLRRMADALTLWTQGLRGHFFNRHGRGFDDEDDVVHLDLGILTASGNEDLLSLAVLSLLAHITAWSERRQASGRHTEVWFDEGHYIAKTPLMVQGFIVGTKVWRKLHNWLVFATQDFSDFSADARQILSQAEFWVLLSMGAAEARQVAQFRDLTPEEQRLLTRALKEPGRFVEGVLLSEKWAPALLRFVPPPLALALAQTEGEEKNHRQRLMREHGLSELDAALRVADEIVEHRRRYQVDSQD
ncbi:MAG TPA: conjugative transfer ATPase [Verrucomicrobiota bacterium]|nr:conjugative transfer ATPase [Verrucomicrobiota bacterium]